VPGIARADESQAREDGVETPCEPRYLVRGRAYAIGYGHAGEMRIYAMEKSAMKYVVRRSIPNPERKRGVRYHPKLRIVSALASHPHEASIRTR